VLVLWVVQLVQVGLCCMQQMLGQEPPSTVPCGKTKIESIGSTIQNWKHSNDVQSLQDLDSNLWRMPAMWIFSLRGN
jgi:hypothetical protein